LHGTADRKKGMYSPPPSLPLFSPFFVPDEDRGHPRCPEWRKNDKSCMGESVRRENMGSPSSPFFFPPPFFLLGTHHYGGGGGGGPNTMPVRIILIVRWGNWLRIWRPMWFSNRFFSFPVFPKFIFFPGSACPVNPSSPLGVLI